MKFKFVLGKETDTSFFEKIRKSKVQMKAFITFEGLIQISDIFDAIVAEGNMFAVCNLGYI